MWSRAEMRWPVANAEVPVQSLWDCAGPNRDLKMGRFHITLWTLNEYQSESCARSDTFSFLDTKLPFSVDLPKMSYFTFCAYEIDWNRHIFWRAKVQRHQTLYTSTSSLVGSSGSIADFEFSWKLWESYFKKPVDPVSSDPSITAIHRIFFHFPEFLWK